MIPILRIGLIAIVAVSLCGCVSGRLGTVDVTDRAVIVRDQNFPTIAIVRGSKVDQLSGIGVAEMDADAKWAVITNMAVVPGTFLLEPEREDSVRLPCASMRQVLTAVSLEDGRRLLVPNPLEEDDWGIWSMAVHGDALFVEVAPRYRGWMDTKPHRYWRKLLPAGDWKTVTEDDWITADDAAKSRVACPNQSPPWSVPVGTHGTLWVNRDNGTWTTTIVAPDIGTIVVLRENDWGIVDTSATLADAFQIRWP